MSENKTAATGIPSLDTLLRSLWIGDNVVWEVDAGSYVELFVDAFVATSLDEGHEVVYFSFNRSPATMVKRLGDLVRSPKFTLYDCFTKGKGHNDPTFSKFYKPRGGRHEGCVLIEKPGDPSVFLNKLNEIEVEKGRRTRYVFDSLTGMQDLWGDENATYRMFTHSCPLLYDLDTVAYWILEKDAHSAAFRANIKHVTQVAIELTNADSMLFLKANKVEGRFSRSLYKPRRYDTDGGKIHFAEYEQAQKLEIGTKIKNLRTQRGITQRDFADRAGVTASFVSQVERNQISPSIASLLQMATELRVEPSYFFLDIQGESPDMALVRKDARRPFFAPALRRSGATVMALTAEAPGRRMESFLVDIPPRAECTEPLFHHKGEEFIMVLRGALELQLQSRTLTASEGDTLYLDLNVPTGWKNPSDKPAQVLWVLSPSRM